MFGCIGRIVVLAVVIIIGAVAFLTRGMWEPRLRERLGAKPRAVAAAPTWEPVTLEGASRVRSAMQAFQRPSGPVFVNASAADLVAFALEPVMRGLSAAVDATPGAPEALAGENLISIRGNIRMADLGGAAALGPMAGMLEGTQRIEVRGRPVVTAPGTARFHIERIAVGNLVIPSAAIGRVVQRLAPRTDASAPADAITLTLPRAVADIRITAGRVTLYKAVK